MKALAYHGSKDVRLDTVPDPILEEADDIILRVTATAICGSDLHLYRGKVPGMKNGDVLGHEFMGIVEDVGKSVKRVKKGDRVVIPFTIACGECYFCDQGLFSGCETTNPDPGMAVNKKGVRSGAGMFGYTHLAGGYAGGQAEYVRVPKGNAGPFKVPEGLPDERVLFLSDILPTGYQAVINGKVRQGSTVAIFGAGPVGLMATACARMLGAERIYLVDHNAYRLQFAQERYGVVPIDFDDVDDPAQFIIEQEKHRGVDCSVDAVGFEAKGSTLETALASMKIEGGSGFVIRQMITCTRRGGNISVPGVYAGWLHAFLLGDSFDKGLNWSMGQTNVQKLMPELLAFIQAGALEPQEIITHRLPLDQAVHGYKIFDEKQEDCRKVILLPGLTTSQPSQS
ncbi:MAG TPA: zinc-dependent alcohol dehydrogenase [Flavobacteriales bacterium]|jgi:threonine dehydrogenase-like Zn-dependent dehydrogenase|nr:zinc-dependent alcohol dehydrogenase [Flavobacteriales bacterium]